MEPIKLSGIILLCISSLCLSAQDNQQLKEAETKVQLHKGIQFLTSGPITFSMTDLAIIDGYDFETYRKSDARYKIQLVKGPLIELLSKKEMQQTATVTGGTQSSVKKEATPGTAGTYDIILQLNIGLGYREKKHVEVSH